MVTKEGYVSLCYHYIRTSKEIERFPLILGISEEEFQTQISLLKKNYNIISLNDVLKFSYSDYYLKNEKPSLLITFDDGLSDHYTAAKILHENNIKGVFFIPTCILEENLPANPMIIHYCIAIFGLKKFLEEFRNALAENKLDKKKFSIPYNHGKDDVWKTIKIIKSTFKYKIGFKSRKLLLQIYKNLLLDEFKDAMEVIHLTSGKIKKMLKMGHFIGTHTHTHISVAANVLTEKDFKKEIIFPKNYLETNFNTSVYAFSYPFGERNDCLTTMELLKKTDAYKLAFTVKKILNTKRTSPFEIGRYQPMSTDTATKLNMILTSIVKRAH